MKRFVTIVFVSLSCVLFLKVQAQQKPWSEQMATTAMSIWKDSFALGGKAAKWTYDQGVVLKGIEGLWKNTGDGKYFKYIEKSMDYWIDSTGKIKTYKLEDYNIDNVNNGKLLLLLYRVTGKEKYWKAAKLLREQLKGQPRTNEGGFWHKKVYPYQMWLDGLYMGEPFYAEYSYFTKDDSAFNDIGNQFIYMENHARDAKTGLLYHGWDESKQMKWANPVTGTSPNFWARAMGWYGMALVDVLDYFPAGNPKRNELLNILSRYAAAISKVQDNKTGLWWDVLDKPLGKGNYLEQSASSMFVYTIAKAVRKGWLDGKYLSTAKKGYAGLIKQFVKVSGDGHVDLDGTVGVSGLGGNPYRDGSYEYYVGEKVVLNDPKGVGAFLLASTEMDLVPSLSLGKGKSVLLDCYFNHETRKDVNGKLEQFHYIWEEQDNGGYSMLGHVFNKFGVQTKSNTEPITAEQLKKTNIYFIIDPDWPKEVKDPKYIEQQHIDVIVDWVKKGGVLMLFANDSNNVEFRHYNQLAEKFGIHFNENYRNMVLGDKYETGTFTIKPGDAIFKTAKTLYLKEICTQNVTAPAKSMLTDKGDVVISVSKFGKGTVFAVGDPWFYNEYLDGRKLPAYLENYKAAEDLVRWLLKQSKP